MGLNTTRTIPITARSVSMDDVIQLYRILKPQVEAAAEIEVRALERLPEDNDEQFERLQIYLRESFELSVVINSGDGETLVERDESIFTSPNLPDQITSIYMDSKATYQVRRNQLQPRNWLTLTLDFSKPPLMDWRNPVSNPTQNLSNLTVSGDENAWVAAICHEIMKRLDNRGNSRGFLHRAFFYDIGVWLIGIPFAFFVTAKLISEITKLFEGFNPVIEVAAYVYVFFLVLVGYRVLFGYTKWAFPTVELISPRDTANKHRKFWYAVMVGIVGTAIWSIFF